MYVCLFESVRLFAWVHYVYFGNQSQKKKTLRLLKKKKRALKKKKNGEDSFLHTYTYKKLPPLFLSLMPFAAPRYHSTPLSFFFVVVVLVIYMHTPSYFLFSFFSIAVQFSSRRDTFI